jgi:hypothetical protein
VSLLEHTVPDDRPAITHSVDTLEAERYRVAWALTRPLPAPCAHWALEAGERVPVGHFPHPDGGCFYGCEETP